MHVLWKLLLACTCFFSFTRLQLQQGRPHSPSPSRPTIPARPKSLKQVFQQVMNTQALSLSCFVLARFHIYSCTFAFFYFSHPGFSLPLDMPSPMFRILSSNFCFPPFFLVLHNLIVTLFMLVSLRLSPFYTVASEECGHRRLER